MSSSSSVSSALDSYIEEALELQFQQLVPDARPRATGRANEKLAELATRGVIKGANKSEWVKTGRVHPVTNSPLYRGCCSRCGDATTVPFMPTPGRAPPRANNIMIIRG